MVKFDLDVGEWGLLLAFLDGLIVLPGKVQEVKDKLDVQYSSLKIGGLFCKFCNSPEVTFLYQSGDEDNVRVRLMYCKVCGKRFEVKG